MGSLIIQILEKTEASVLNNLPKATQLETSWSLKPGRQSHPELKLPTITLTHLSGSPPLPHHPRGAPDNPQRGSDHGSQPHSWPLTLYQSSPDSLILCNNHKPQWHAAINIHFPTSLQGSGAFGCSGLGLSGSQLVQLTGRLMVGRWAGPEVGPMLTCLT